MEGKMLVSTMTTKTMTSSPSEEDRTTNGIASGEATSEILVLAMVGILLAIKLAISSEQFTSLLTSAVGVLLGTACILAAVAVVVIAVG